ncbi:MAG: hypothetical protein ACRC78_18320 [Planktothrix sp.]
MEKYKFLTRNPATCEPQQEISYLAISEDRIQILNLSDCYGSFGRAVSSDNAGDTVEIKSQKVCQFIQSYIEENDIDIEIEYSIGDIIAAYENYSLYRAIEKEFPHNEDSINDVVYQKTTVEGFNYWDGSNWATIIVASDGFSEPNYLLLDDEELEKSLNEAIENRSYKGKGSGVTYYEHIDEGGNTYSIVDSYWQGDFEAYSISIE